MGEFDLDYSLTCVDCQVKFVTGQASLWMEPIQLGYVLTFFGDCLTDFPLEEPAVRFLLSLSLMHLGVFFGC
jgi:hypothetical protein